MYRRLDQLQILRRHQAIQPRMRAILLDWLIEVCEVYKLHRETFYLAVDFIDRYLSVTEGIPKTRLQLLGKQGKNPRGLFETHVSFDNFSRVSIFLSFRRFLSVHRRQDRRDLSAQDHGLRLRHGRRVQRGGDPHHGTRHPQGTQLGPQSHDAQRLDEALHAGMSTTLRRFQNHVFIHCQPRDDVF